MSAISIVDYQRQGHFTMSIALVISYLIHQIKVSSKLKYKLAIKSALLEFENKHDDELYLNFLNKKIPDFWKCWSRKFNKRISNDVYINGSSRSADIANSFAQHVNSVYCDSSDATGAKNNNLKICILIPII